MCIGATRYIVTSIEYEVARQTLSSCYCSVVDGEGVAQGKDVLPAPVLHVNHLAMLGGGRGCLGGRRRAGGEENSHKRNQQVVMMLCLSPVPPPPPPTNRKLSAS